MEEERRLFYVGMTRAMEQLYLCHAEVRRLYGKDHYTRSSRFLDEVPDEHLDEIRSRAFSRPLQRGPTPTPGHRPATDSSRAVTYGMRSSARAWCCPWRAKGSTYGSRSTSGKWGPKWILPAYARLEMV